MRLTNALGLNKMYWVMILVGLTIIFLSSTSALTPVASISKCYQENANASNVNDCSYFQTLNYTGKYLGYNWTNEANMYDGDIATSAEKNYTNTKSVIYINYTRPKFDNASSAVWGLYWSSGTASSNNMTIPRNCFNETISMLINESSNTLNFYCFNYTSSSWWMITNNARDPVLRIHEEYIIWNVSSVVEVSQNYSQNVSELQTTNLFLNITYDNTKFINVEATLYHNNTAYTGLKRTVGNYTIFNATVYTPTVSIPTNKSFYWNITLYTGSSSETYSTFMYNQTILPNNIGTCSASLPTKIYNFTVYDERTLARIFDHDFYGTLYYGATQKVKQLLINNIDVNETIICSANNGTVFIDGSIEYSNGSRYVIRDYYLINANTSVYPQNISLYLLPVEDSTTFIIKVQDVNLLPMSGVYVLIERYYPATDTYKTVQIVKTDESGKSVAFYEAENAYYRHTIKDANGVTIYTTEKQKVFPEQVPYTLTFTVGESISNPITDFIEDEYSTGNITYNNNTKMVTLTYIDTSSNFDLGRLYVELNKWSSYDELVCNNNSTLSSAIITCNLSAYTDGTFTAKFYITRDGVEQLIDSTTININEIVNVMGNEGLFLAWFIILTAGLIFLGNMIAGIWAVNFAVIFTNVIGLAKFNPVFIFGMIAISILLTVALKQD